MMAPICKARAVATSVAFIAITGCGAPRRVTTAPLPVAATAPVLRNDIHWFRSSAEYRGIALEVYRSAAEHLPELIREQRAGSWAVILDADETVLDNSLSERRDADLGRPYTDTAWTTWVRQRAATAIPGAVDFTRKVHALGGKVVIVSNRPDSLCTPTRENLDQIGVAADIVLCGPAGVTDKNPRFERVEQGTAVPGVPPLHVVEWIGDNIEDFPALHQSVRSTADGYRDFGVKYFLLPNPMYGSWTRNPEP